MKLLVEPPPSEPRMTPAAAAGLRAGRVCGKLPLDVRYGQASVC